MIFVECMYQSHASFPYMYCIGRARILSWRKLLPFWPPAFMGKIYPMNFLSRVNDCNYRAYGNLTTCIERKFIPLNISEIIINAKVARLSESFVLLKFIAVRYIPLLNFS